MPKLNLPSVDEIEDVQTAVDRLLERKEELEEFVELLPTDKRDAEQIEELQSAVDNLLEKQDALEEFTEAVIKTQAQVQGLIDTVDELNERLSHSFAVIDKFATDAEEALR